MQWRILFEFVPSTQFFVSIISMKIYGSTFINSRNVWPFVWQTREEKKRIERREIDNPVIGEGKAQ